MKRVSSSIEAVVTEVCASLESLILARPSSLLTTLVVATLAALITLVASGRVLMSLHFAATGPGNEREGSLPKGVVGVLTES